MVRDIEVTLYDVFGYLYPGAVLLVAIAVAAWAVFFPAVEPAVPSVSFQGWILIVFVSYLLGHITQAIGNLLTAVYPTVQDLDADQKRYTPDALVEAAYDRAYSMTGVPREQFTWEALGRLCDTTITQCGLVADRDVYVYRQGFYRGISISFFALALALLLVGIKLCLGMLSLRAVGFPSCSWLAVVGTALVLSVGAGLLFRARFKHFVAVRTTAQIHAFLVLHGKRLLEAQEGGGTDA
ncbi:MAG TPA: hypothetical protein GX714_15470 [Chloroflexi bacterium]|jgi:hypothetical protein|nr:hypothetical protein [Chloroflexota bacterium]